jgi:hypothetical protein
MPAKTAPPAKTTAATPEVKPAEVKVVPALPDLSAIEEVDSFLTAQGRRSIVPPAYLDAVKRSKEIGKTLRLPVDDEQQGAQVLKVLRQAGQQLGLSVRRELAKRTEGDTVKWYVSFLAADVKPRGKSAETAGTPNPAVNVPASAD